MRLALAAPQPAATFACNNQRCPSDGIGRRSGLKIRRRKACRFKSGLGHHQFEEKRRPARRFFFAWRQAALP
jgi:hypothetical protein